MIPRRLTIFQDFNLQKWYNFLYHFRFRKAGNSGHYLSKTVERILGHFLPSSMLGLKSHLLYR
jgi:hypothetical protein